MCEIIRCRLWNNNSSITYAAITFRKMLCITLILQYALLGHEITIIRVVKTASLLRYWIQFLNRKGDLFHPSLFPKPRSLSSTTMKGSVPHRRQDRLERIWHILSYQQSTSPKTDSFTPRSFLGWYHLLRLLLHPQSQWLPSSVPRVCWCQIMS